MPEAGPEEELEEEEMLSFRHFLRTGISRKDSI